MMIVRLIECPDKLLNKVYLDVFRSVRQVLIASLSSGARECADSRTLPQGESLLFLTFVRLKLVLDGALFAISRRHTDGYAGVHDCFGNGEDLHLRRTTHGSPVAGVFTA